ncbi:tryptophan 7-halogenase [Temperatibacter marinus]|uniref:Tryptophan 7-halogenase n=2 Tax=Temperatibacter marinus TaxID=1456591 RepID=A0AA52EG87_9PROT|nr:tryptophan 7-halogenase [Temperatibacter marinus]
MASGSSIFSIRQTVFFNKAPDLQEYSLACMAAKKGKFMRPVNAGNSPLSNIVYAFHFDAGLYAKYLREYAEDRGVRRTEGMVDSVASSKENGFIEAVTLKSGAKIDGDLFIDCSGTRGLLIQGALKTGYTDWTHWLPCNRAVAVPSETGRAPEPYTKSIAHSAGWQWRIPLQHRTGNGHVFAADYMSEDEATSILMNNLPGKPLAEPRVIPFTTGKRNKFWHKNCVAIGLSSGFMEPLESTSIHLIQAAIAKLLALFPDRDFHQSTIDKYNEQTHWDYDRIRDFLILHYKATEREDSEFWRYCKQMEIPSFLQDKIDIYKASGRIFRENDELFNDVSWLAVLNGQGIRPSGYHPLVDIHSEEEIDRRLQNVKSVIDRSVETMPSQSDFIAQNCAMAPEVQS